MPANSTESQSAFIARPPRKAGTSDLSQHLRTVADLTVAELPSDGTSPTGRPLEDHARVAGLLHDIAKACPTIQQYIDPNHHVSQSEHTSHAPLGASITYLVLDELDWEPQDWLIVWTAIGKHHGDLPDMDSFLELYGDEKNAVYNAREGVGVQATEISGDEDAREFINTILEEVTDSLGVSRTVQWGDIAPELESGEIFSDLLPFGESLFGVRGDFSETLYDSTLQLWSALCLADRTDAAGLSPTDLDGKSLNTETITAEIDSVESDGSDSPLNTYRSEARRAVRETAQAEMRAGGFGVGTITLPTGLGKTYTGVETALTIRDMKPGDGRLIYALPFTSIIDQTIADLEDVFDADSTGEQLTAHHYLEDTITESETDGESYRDGQKALLGETWRTGGTVTTFVQLFETLTGPTSQQSMKLPALENAVIIVDEPQSLPVEWWPLVVRLFELVVEQYNATVLNMTATQPSIFDVRDTDLDPVSLVPDRDRYFGAVERVEYRLHESTAEYLADREAVGMGYQQAASELAEHITETGEDALAICNTVRSTRELHGELDHDLRSDFETVVDLADEITPLLEDSDGFGVDDSAIESVAERIEADADSDTVVLGHLSSRLRPADRQILIEAIKSLVEKDVVVAVTSTQVVEAGVDISFESVFRDFAPVDSIIQAAGRCNRNNESDCGTVTVWRLGRLDENHTRTPSELVYARRANKLDETASAINTVVSVSKSDASEFRVSEPEMTVAISDAYYAGLTNRDQGEGAWPELVDEAQGAELRGVSLIDDDSVDVAVIRTEQEQDCVDAIKAAIDDNQYGEARSKMSNFRNRVVSKRGDSVTEIGFEEEDRIAGESSFPVVIDAASPRFDSCFGILDQ